MDRLLIMLAVLATGLVLAALVRRRAAARADVQSLGDRAIALERGSHRARLQHPSVDLSNCIGCGACVRACPEEGVLQMAYGQAVVVHGARCVGHGLCAEACPTSAIALTLGDLSSRRDLPAVDDRNEAIGVEGLFLAGEITGFALVRTAVAHGAAVAAAVRERILAAASARERDGSVDGPEQLADLIVIGAGPAGLSCLLAARQHGLAAYGLDQAECIGGTVASYPRRKLVMTQPMQLPLHGRLDRLEYTREQLVELWQDLAARHELDVRLQTTVQRIDRLPDGGFEVVTDSGSHRARYVCLAVGRRGTPRRLGVPGEQLDKVAYSMLDAAGYRDRKILVVGGGDSAVEAALALAEQPGNEVVLSYRREHFSRLKAKNERRIQAAFEDGLVQARLGTSVSEITSDGVTLRASMGADPGDGGDGGAVATVATEQLGNDYVFVFAGGTPPFPMLESAGVSFDASLLQDREVRLERGGGLLVALVFTLVGLCALAAVRLVFSGYYELEVAWRPSSELHRLLRPQGLLGLCCGVLAVTLFCANLCYLVRRASRIGRRLPGTLRGWMNAHVATGIGAFLCAVLHSSFSVRDSAGGHALVAMGVVVVAGVVGRWFYAFVPRAQNGRQQHIEELSQRVAAIATEWDRDGRGVGVEARQMVEEVVERAEIGHSLPGRIWGLVRSHWQMRRRLERFAASASREGVPPNEIARMVRLSQRSFRLALQLAHYDDLRALLSTWRWLHRWLALVLLILLVVHVVAAVRYGGIDWSALSAGGPR